jgi:hypothetical protein
MKRVHKAGSLQPNLTEIRGRAGALGRWVLACRPSSIVRAASRTERDT